MKEWLARGGRSAADAGHETGRGAAKSSADAGKNTNADAIEKANAGANEKANAGASISARGFMALGASVLGTALQLMQGSLWPDSIYAALVGLGLVLLWLQASVCMRRGGALLVVAVAGLCMGAGQTGWRAVVFQAQALSPGVEGKDVRITGVVAQMPQRGDTGIRFQFNVQSVQGVPDVQSAQQAQSAAGKTDTAPPRVPPRLSLSWYAPGSGMWGRDGAAPSGQAAVPALPELPEQAGPTLHAGERWQFTVRLKAPHGNRNPHGFDYELWLWEQGVQATGYVRAGMHDAPPQRLASTWRHPVERAREAVRDAILARNAAQPQPSAGSRAMGVVAALVTGDQAAIERADWDVFRATGVAHLMSISGLHITLFAWLAAGAVGALWRRSDRLMLWRPAPHAALIGGVLLATAYALFSGWGVPAQRTVGMLAIVTLLRGGARQWPWPCIWLLVCACVVAFDPWALLQAGFWLSFVAVGVLFASDAGLAARLHDVHPSAMRRLAGQGARLLREQWVVTVALTPLSLLLFQQVSVVGFVANLLAIPWVTLVVTPLAMLGVLAPPLWDVAAWAVRALAFGLSWLASWPMATWSAPAAPLWAGVAGVLGGLLLAMRLPLSLRLMGLPLLLPVLLWQTPRPAPGEFDVLAADVGQGTAVLLRTAQHSLLYDTGPRYSLDSDAGHRVLVPLLRALGERPHTVVLSHRDSDHTGGAAAVLALHPQAQLLASIEAEHPLQALRPAQRCEAGQRWVWDGVQFELLHPQADDYTRFAVRPNALSCVLRVSNGRAAVLLTGDIERAQEAALVARSADAGQSLQADLLIVPHHGSKTSSSDALLQAVAPRLALAQSGWRNRFGHPAPEVTQRLRQHGIGVFDSPHCGAAQWQSSRPEQLRCERLLAARYWQHRPPPAP